MTDFNPPCQVFPTAQVHKSFLDRIWIGAACIPIPEARIVAADPNTPPEVRDSINEAIDAQSRRALSLEFGRIS